MNGESVKMVMEDGGRGRGGRDPKGPGWSYSRVVAQDRWGESRKCWACRMCGGGWITELVIWRFVWLALYAK